MKTKKGIFLALLFSLLMAVNVWADDGVSQTPDYSTNYYMIVESAAGGIDIHSEADPESDKLNEELIPNGTALLIEGEKTGTDNKNWGYTRYHGMNGYVQMDDLKPATLAEAIESEIRTFGVSDVDLNVKVNEEHGAALYKGPGEKFGEIKGAAVEEGKDVHVTQILEAEDDKIWGKTITEINEGWVDLGRTDYERPVSVEIADEGNTAEAKAEETPEVKAVPTVTPAPTATPVPTATPTPEPTVTTAPTATPEPTATTAPTSTPEPTATQEPTPTEEAAPTEEPEATPTEEAEAAPTEEPEVTPEEKSEDASTENVKAESSVSPLVWAGIIGLLIIIILLLAYFFKNKKDNGNK